jgi:hypothetical protein
LISKGKEGYLFSGKGECMHGKLSFLDYHVSYLGFEDPITSIFESYFSDSQKISYFIISPALVGDYGFIKESISPLLYLYDYLLISDIDGIISVLKLFEWLLWKYDFT